MTDNTKNDGNDGEKIKNGVRVRRNHGWRRLMSIETALLNGVGPFIYT